MPLLSFFNFYFFLKVINKNFYFFFFFQIMNKINNENSNKVNVNNENDNYKSVFDDFEELKIPKDNKENEINGFTILEPDIKKNKSVNEISQVSELIKSSVVFFPKNNYSFFSSLKSITSTLIYNHIISNIKLNLNEIKEPFVIFDKILDKNKLTAFKLQLLTFLFMSYRNNFTNLKQIEGGNYTTDCGWGCMLRSSQMLVSKGLIERKIYKNKIKDLNKNDLNTIRKDVLICFLDDTISIENILSNIDYQYFLNQYKKLCQFDMRYYSLTEIIPPFSIQMLCKIGKCSGQFTSDINMIKTFMKINKEMFNDLEFIHFECGTLYKEKILKVCCEELFCSCNNNNFSILEDNINDKSSICDNCFNECLLKNKITADDILIENKRKFLFNQSCIIFISFRLGLKEIHPDNIKIIPDLFMRFHNNLGFISGKENKAFYFIGLNGEKLMFVDPHLNQVSIKGNLSDISSYFIKEIYLMDIKDISSALTMGIIINTISDLKTFFSDVNWFIKNHPFFLKYDDK